MYKILGWPKTSFTFFHNILQKTLSEIFGQPNIYIYIYKIRSDQPLSRVQLFATP